MFEPAVDRSGGSVAGAGAVEVGQDVGGALGQGPSERDDLAQRARHAVADRLDQLLHLPPPVGPVRFAVGRDHPLVDPPGRLDLQVLIVGEQVLQLVLLLVGEQVGAGVQGPAGGVVRVAVTATATAGVLLDPAAALVEGVTGQAHMTATASGSSSVAAVLNPVNPSIATSTPSRHTSSRSLSHCWKACLERPATMSSSRAGRVPSLTPVRSMIT